MAIEMMWFLEANANTIGAEEANMIRESATAVVTILAALAIGPACQPQSLGSRPLEPTLPLPEVTAESNQLPEQPLWSSTRAWHYNPRLVRPLWDVWAAFEEPPLTMRMKVMVAAVTDSRNRCPYCLSSAVCFLENEGLSEAQILQLQTDIAGGDFSEKEKALLLLAEQITVDPSSAHAGVGRALAADWTQAEVAQAIFVAAYFNMLNRISEAFALPPDADHPFDPSPSFPLLHCGAA